MGFEQRQIQQELHPTSLRYLWLILAIFLQVCLILILIPATRPYAAPVELGLLQSAGTCWLLFRLRRRFSPKVAVLLYLLGAIVLVIVELNFVMRHPFVEGLVGVVISSLIINPLFMDFLWRLYGPSPQKTAQLPYTREEVNESKKFEGILDGWRRLGKRGG